MKKFQAAVSFFLCIFMLVQNSFLVYAGESANKEDWNKIYLGSDVHREVIEKQAVNNPKSPKVARIVTYVSKPIRYNLFTPVSDYVASNYPTALGTVSVMSGCHTTINASISAGAQVDLLFLQSNINASMGVGVTFITTQTISYQVPTGYKGRIVLRYSQDYYSFTVEVAGVPQNGSGYTKAYDEYYNLQLISL